MRLPLLKLSDLLFGAMIPPDWSHDNLPFVWYSSWSCFGVVMPHAFWVFDLDWKSLTRLYFMFNCGIVNPTETYAVYIFVSDRLKYPLKFTCHRGVWTKKPQNHQVLGHQQPSTRQRRLVLVTSAWAGHRVDVSLDRLLKIGQCQQLGIGHVIHWPLGWSLDITDCFCRDP